MSFKSFLTMQRIETLVLLWNEFCSGDDYIYQGVEAMADAYSNPLDFARAVYYGDVRGWNDAYATLNGYGNIVTFNYYDDENSPIDLNTLAEWLEESENEHELYQAWAEENGDEE